VSKPGIVHQHPDRKAGQFLTQSIKLVPTREVRFEYADSGVAAGCQALRQLLESLAAAGYNGNVPSLLGQSLGIRLANPG
jgi:hypothetical protein